MNIVFLHQDIGHIYGAEKVTQDLVSGLIQSGLSVHMLLLEESRLQLDQSPFRLSLQQAGIPFTVIPVRHAVAPGTIPVIAGHLKALQATVLHTSGYKADVLGLPAARRAGIPAVATVHGWLFRADPKERFYGWLNTQVLKRFDRVIVLSRFYRSMMLQQGISSHRLRIIPSGIPLPPTPSALYRAGDSCTIGILGRLSEEKNHRMFLRAAQHLVQRRLPTPKLQFLIAGDGPEKASIQRQITRLGLSRYCQLTGYMDRDAFFSQCNLFVLTSCIENLPRTIQEAMTRRVPVVATDVGGIPDLITNGVTGRLVPSNQPEELADTLQHLLLHPEQLTWLSDAAFQHIRTHNAPERWVRGHYKLYSELQ